MYTLLSLFDDSLRALSLSSWPHVKTQVVGFIIIQKKNFWRVIQIWWNELRPYFRISLMKVNYRLPALKSCQWIRLRHPLRIICKVISRAPSLSLSLCSSLPLYGVLCVYMCAVSISVSENKPRHPLCITHGLINLITLIYPDMLS